MRKFKLFDTGIKGKALCLLDDIHLLIYYKCKFRLISLSENRVISKFVLPITKWKGILCRIRLCERALHIEPRWGIPLDEKHVLISFSNSFYRVDVYTGEFYEEIIDVKGKPLSVCHIKDVPGFNSSYVVGDYFSNPNREEVKLYSRGENDLEWKTVYVFPAGTIRHIHNIIPDKEKNRVLILTGDDDKESGIWEAQNGFVDVHPLVIGSQQCRACQVGIFKNQIYYATDAPSEPNYIYRINKENTIERVCEIRGSCIYGNVVDGLWCFSTTCEPEAHAKNFIDYWLTRKHGKGIQDNRIDICVVDRDANIYIIDTFMGDGLPLRLFQYASVCFAHVYPEKTKRVFLTPVCVKKMDMHIMELIQD